MTHLVRAVIFDVDGTLVNSNDAHARAWIEALTERGFDVPFERVRPLIGMGGDKLLPELIGVRHDAGLGQEIARRRAEIFRTRFLPKIRAFPRTRELFQRLRERGLRLAVASSAQAEELEPLLSLAGVSEWVEERTSSNDAKRSKPDPDIIGAALTRLELEPRRVLMVGDTRYDIEAAARSGTAAIALRSGGQSDAELSGARAIYDDPADLLEHLEDWCFGNSAS